jgi:hypothetical protein
MSEYDVHRTTETGPTPTLRPYEPLGHPSPSAAPPLISGAVAAVLAALATVGGFAAGILSSPQSWIVAALAVACAVVAGVKGFDVPKFTVGRPLVKAALIGPLTTVAGLAIDYAITLPGGYLRGALGVVAIVCVGLAGVPLPRALR